MAGDYRHRCILDLVLGMDVARYSVSGFYFIAFIRHSNYTLHYSVNSRDCGKNKTRRPPMGMARA